MLSDRPRRRFKFVVGGAVVADVISYLERMPAPGRASVKADIWRTVGGNAANDSIVLEGLGHMPFLVARVGDDGLGKDLLYELHAVAETTRIDTSFVEREPGVPTPVCNVFRDANRDNYVVWGLSETQVASPETILAAEDAFEQADAVLATFELPPPALTTLIELADSYDKKIFLNAGPARTGDELKGVPFHKVHTLVCNEFEAESMLSSKSRPFRGGDRAFALARNFGIKHVCVTQGKRGVRLWDGVKSQEFPAFLVPIVDPTAAGDAFVSTYAAFTMEGHEPEEAIQFALAASAFAVQHTGTADSLPNREDVLRLLTTQQKGPKPPLNKGHKFSQKQVLRTRRMSRPNAKGQHVLTTARPLGRGK